MRVRRRRHFLGMDAAPRRADRAAPLRARLGRIGRGRGADRARRSRRRGRCGSGGRDPRRHGGRLVAAARGAASCGRLGDERRGLCGGRVVWPGAAAPRSAMGCHGAFIPVRNRLGDRYFGVFLGSDDRRSAAVAAREPEQDLGRRHRRPPRRTCGRRRRRLCERGRRVGGGGSHGVGAVSPGAGRRFAGIRRQAPVRRQGCEPSDPRSRRPDGPARQLYRRRFGRAPDRHVAPRNCCTRPRLAGMVAQ